MLLSVPVLLLILLLRISVCKRAVFMRGMLWGILLLLPFTPKLFLYYRTKLGVQIFFRWTVIVTSYKLVAHIYMVGVLLSAIRMMQRRIRLLRWLRGMERTNYKGMELLVTDLRITPFATGLFHPKIVCPRCLFAEMDEEQLQLVLMHEQTHIRLLHLWFYKIYDILTVLMFANPLFYILRPCFRDDLEEICDKVCIRNTSDRAIDYGMMLLESVELLRLPAENRLLITKHLPGLLDTEFNKMKRRIMKIRTYRPYKKKVICALVLCGAFIALIGVALIRQNSYHYQTKDDDYIAVVDEHGSIYINTSEMPELFSVIDMDGKVAHIDSDRLDEILLEKRREGIPDLLYIYYGGFSKTPGFGGGGNGFFIEEYNEKSGIIDVPYERQKDDWRTWVIRYLWI